MPQSQGDNPVEQREEDSNDKGAQEKISEENDFFAFHVFIDYFARSERCAPIFPSDTVAAVCERRRRKWGVRFVGGHRPPLQPRNKSA
jgi:hypothetical protein